MALNTKRDNIVVRTLHMIQCLIESSNEVAENLVPYYRQLLPVFNLLRSKNSTCVTQRISATRSTTGKGRRTTLAI